MRADFSLRARDDLVQIHEYIADAGAPSAADRLIDSILTLCDNLVDMPGMGRRRPEFDALGLEPNCISEGNYAIFYIEHEEKLIVLRILHSARDIDASEFEFLGIIN